jgi:hypothetical protein
VRRQSLFQEALGEAERHKYLESEKAGHDLGQSAIEDWHRRHWTIWLRHRWLEHLLGTTCWEEFEPERFGRLRALFGAHARLLDEIIERVRRGAENIDILCWAAVERRDMDAVVRMLIELRLNEIRCTRYCLSLF